MELWQEMIMAMTNEWVHLIKNDFEGVADLLNNKCYDALREIKRILEDDTLDDKECFYKIEKIVCVFEALGSNGGNRHDFG